MRSSTPLLSTLSLLLVSLSSVHSLPVDGGDDSSSSSEQATSTTGPSTVSIPLAHRLSSGVTDLKQLLTAPEGGSENKTEGRATLSTLSSWASYMQAKYTVADENDNKNEKRQSTGEESLMAVNGWSYYVGLISVGEPSLDHQVLIDTGSSDLWMYNNKWNGTGRDGLPVYDTAQRCGNQTFSIVYADNSRMSGSVCKDTIGLDGISYADQGIGKVFSWTQTLTLADGILGLGLEKVSRMGETPFAVNLFKNNSIPAGEFSFDLAGGSPSILIGGHDDTKYTGEMSYSPIAGDGRWNVTLGGASVAGNSIDTLNDVPVILDTGSSLIGFPASVAASMYEHVPGALPLQNISLHVVGAGMYVAPCDSKATFEFTFNNATFDVPVLVKGSPPTQVGNDSYCLAAVAGIDFTPTAYIMGIPFLRSVYSVFDFDNSRVGLATPSSLVTGLMNTDKNTTKVSQ